MRLKQSWLFFNQTQSSNAKAKWALGLSAAAVILASAFSASTGAQSYTVSASQRDTAQQVAQSGVALSELSATAPDSYTVKSGDTLWAISRLFLQRPWRWPELWGMNLDQIRNPHLIYPGQMLYLDKSGGRARLRVGQAVDGSGNQTVRLSPRARGESVPLLPIATISPRVIEPFLTEPLIVEESTLNTAPRVVATQEERVLLGTGDLAYVRGELGDATNFQAFRPAKPLRDPDTKQILAYESAYLGTLDLLRKGRWIATPDTASNAPGFLNGLKQLINGNYKENDSTEEASTMRVVSFRQEISKGDRLMPTPERELFSYSPRAPANEIQGKVLGIYEGVALAGQNSVVSINRGKNDGLERGNVLALWRSGSTINDKTADDKREKVILPDERYGYMLVFRVFDRVSYALILQVENTVVVGDRFGNP